MQYPSRLLLAGTIPARMRHASLLALLLVGLLPASAGDNSYTTSWVGNTFGRAGNKWVQNQILDLHVRPDGTCLTDSSWDECGREAGRYRNGDVRTDYLLDIHSKGGGLAVTSDGTYIWCAIKWDQGKLRRWNYSNGSLATFSGGEEDGSFLTVDSSAYGMVTGLATAGGKLFAATRGGKIRVYNSSTMAFVQEWAVEGPGQMTVDANGNLWVISNGGMTAWLNGTPNITPKILRYSPTGTKLTQEIAGLPGPRGLAIDNQGRLLVGVNGDKQQVYIYANINSTPTLAGTLGDLGGLMNGSQPGVVTPTKFHNITGVGADSVGNIYVAWTGSNNDNTGNGTVLRSLTAAGALNWEVVGLEFIDVAAVDPATDGADVYTKQEHFTIDFSKSAGQDCTWKGYTVDPVRYPSDWRNQITFTHSYAFEMRRIGGKKFLYTGDMNFNHIGVIRFANDNGASNNETGIPCVGYGADWMWRDTNGNGLWDDTGSSTGLGNKVHGFFVDENGGIWIANEFCQIFYYPANGLDANGVPNYGVTPAKSFSVTGDFTVLGRVAYVAATDSLYVGGYTTAYPVNGQYGNFQVIKKFQGALGASSLSAAQWTLVASANNSGKCMYADDQYVFACDVNPAVVRCYKASDASLVQTLQPGAEVGSTQGWVDIPNGLKEFRRASGEYLVFLEEDAFAKVLMWRWQAPGSTSAVAAPSFSPTAGAYSSAQSVTISTATSGATIRYTTDGSTPSATVGTVYSSVLSISATTTLKAIATKSGMTDSTVTSGTYTITSGGPSGYTYCADENQTYTLSGTCDVAYGANGSFNYLYNRTGSITFNNATFGDPIPGVAKKGYYKSGSVGGTYTASTGFSSTQGANQWSYKQWNGSAYSDMSWNSTDSYWKGTPTYCLIGSTWQHPDSTDSVRVWKAPAAGTVTVTGTVKKAVTTGGDGVRARIMKNGTQVWPASGWQSIAYNDATGVSHNFTADVVQDDLLYFGRFRV